jgi:hypothetical protein
VLHSFQRLPAILRASLLGLLMLAIAFKPMSSLVCETHQLGHLLAAASHESFHEDSAAELQLDADHANGGHGLLHAGDHGGTDAGIPAVVTVQVVRLESALICLPTALPVPVQHVTNPFRPPIA